MGRGLLDFVLIDHRPYRASRGKLIPPPLVVRRIDCKKLEPEKLQLSSFASFLFAKRISPIESGQQRKRGRWTRFATRTAPARTTTS